MSEDKNLYEENNFQVPSDELRWTCPESLFSFNSTKELKPLNDIIGQPRAIDAITLGVTMQSKGYNVFVTGLSGTGRTSTVKKVVEESIAADNYQYPIYDFCYVNNFSVPSKPTLLRLRQGVGLEFAQSVDSAIEYIKEHLPKHYESKAFQNGRKKLIETFQLKEQKSLDIFDEKAKKVGFVRGQIEHPQGGVQPDIFIKLEDKAHRIEELSALVQDKTITEKQAKQYENTYDKLRVELFELMQEAVKLSRVMKTQIWEYDKSSSESIIQPSFDEISEKFADKDVDEYINHTVAYILNNLSLFTVQKDSQSNPVAPVKSGPRDPFNVFKVNVILDNSETKTRPVIIETNPNISNLFGFIEKDSDERGLWVSDFTKIHAGSLLKADQGFLLVNANDLFQEAGVWHALKRVLLYGQLDIQPFDNYFNMSQSSIKPEVIKVNIKVIIIGGISLYNLLYQNEKGFKKMFKVLAQFADSTNNSDEIISNYPQFIAKICIEDELPHANISAVAALVEWSAELAGSKTKISLRFSDVSDMIRESGHYAKLNNHKFMTSKDVIQAKEGRQYRYGLSDERILQAIKENSIIIDTDGKKVGQINGLAVYSTGVISFGKPSRITSAISVGTKGIVNIEREANMSGNIHNKGVLIITGFLYEKFGSKIPLSLTASIAFEQNYGGIDGDSASAAEIYVLLSAITRIPIKQNLAVTGSMNQKGIIQPIGGVNEKITGFYELCRERGFTGDQAVVIPKQNVKDLMLRQDVIEDIEKGNFAIHAIGKIEDGIPLFFDMPAGETDDHGNYPADTLFGLTIKKIKELRKALRNAPEKQKQTLKKEKLDRIKKKRC